MTGIKKPSLFRCLISTACCWMAVCVTLFPLPPGATEQNGKIKLLIIEGVSNHDWKHRLELVKQILARAGSFYIDVSITPSLEGDQAWATWRPPFTKYDVVLSAYNNLGGKAGWPPAVQTEFENYIRK